MREEEVDKRNGRMGDGGGENQRVRYTWKQICGTMRTAAVETWEENIREDNIRHIEREIFDGVPLGGTTTAASMAPSPSPAKERLIKKRPAQHIICRITKTETVSQLAYQTQDCSGRSRQ